MISPLHFSHSLIVFTLLANLGLLTSLRFPIPSSAFWASLKRYSIDCAFSWFLAMLNLKRLGQGCWSTGVRLLEGDRRVGELLGCMRGLLFQNFLHKWTLNLTSETSFPQTTPKRCHWFLLLQDHCPGLSIRRYDPELSLLPFHVDPSILLLPHPHLLLSPPVLFSMQLSR